MSKSTICSVCGKSLERKFYMNTCEECFNRRGLDRAEFVRYK